jgi:hypothetical protein
MPEAQEQTRATPGPWEAATGPYGKRRVLSWEIRKHVFNQPPFEGNLEDEWGVYPPLGEAGPVALVAGEANAQLVCAAPELKNGCSALLGLLQLLAERADVSDDLRAALTSGHRIDEARAAIAKAEGR